MSFKDEVDLVIMDLVYLAGGVLYHNVNEIPSKVLVVVHVSNVCFQQYLTLKKHFLL